MIEEKENGDLKVATKYIDMGCEHGIHHWIIDRTHIDPILIIVMAESGAYESTIYHCQHAPVFGYDVADMNEVKKILDRMIAKYANDGYKNELCLTMRTASVM